MNRPSTSKRARYALTAISLAIGLGAACSQQRPTYFPGVSSPTPRLPPAASTSTALNTMNSPPPPGPAPQWTFPAFRDQVLANGLLLRVIERRTLPLVDVELVVKSGSATDGAKPGLAEVSGELLKAGGAGKWTSRTLLDAAASLGSSLNVTTDRDSTRIAMAVTRDKLEAAIDMLAAVATQPRFQPGEFQKLKQREVDRVSNLSRADPQWVAAMVLYRRLFEVSVGINPYSRFDATVRQLKALTLDDCRAWHARQVTPKNSLLVISGDVSAQEAERAAHQAFDSWQGERPERPDSPAPLPPNALSIYLVDRPQSPQAFITVATLGPDRKSPAWPVMRVTNQILGGGVASRLFLDVREKQSLAYRVGSPVEPFAQGPSAIQLSAGTQTANTGLAVAALLEQFDALANAPPTAQETEVATQYLSNVFLVNVDTVATIANLSADLAVFGLAPGYYDWYRAAVREVSRESVYALSTQFFRRDKAIVVVAGDAARVTKQLSHFAEVHVVDPDNDFATNRIVAYDPAADIASLR